jgi:hypothetical protein
MSSNLPPGVSVNDLPGNSPSDVRYELAYEAWLESFDYDDVTSAIVEVVLANVVDTYRMRPFLTRAIGDALGKMDGNEVAAIAVAHDVIGAFVDPNDSGADCYCGRCNDDGDRRYEERRDEPRDEAFTYD